MLDLKILLASLARIRIPGEARQVLDAFLVSDTPYISISKFSRATGIKTSKVSRALGKLKSMNILLPHMGEWGIPQTGEQEVKRYRFNADPVTWRDIPHKGEWVSPKRGNSKPKIDRVEETFNRFWRAYPKTGNRDEALELFREINPDKQTFADMLADLEHSKKSEGWRREEGKYVPGPVRWLRNRSWEQDQIEPEEDPDDAFQRMVAQSERESLERYEESLRMYGPMDKKDEDYMREHGVVWEKKEENHG